ncbi:hypothetical protein CF67_03049 [Candidatus Photodesmus blepharus]|uniref:Outer membrane protein beta-barrel domain-containing protein n=1 Tax=Candidatus Photodesmus blepharonis TaxID=1179155 RepID=A0A084CN53_9GAMM|nr:outer membrane beta-barrel protein [Candidatus Photodesmus blepharus]KEY91232.1 hypothetical protein CF67_03049 [Candidatus Photodesmus blepharus]
MKNILLALIFSLVPASVFADSWIYGGVATGQSDYGGVSTLSYSVHAGTGILPLIGVEAGYANHGKFKLIDSDMEISSVYFALKPSLNIGPLEIYAKGGIHSWSLSSINLVNGYNIMYGFGAEYAVYGLFSLGANYMSYQLDKGKEDVSTFSFTASFHFL